MPFINQGPTRSQLVAEMLRKQQRRHSKEPNPYGGWEALSRVGARLVDSYMGKKQIDEEMDRRGASQKNLQDAMTALTRGTYKAGQARDTVTDGGEFDYQPQQLDPDVFGQVAQPTLQDLAAQPTPQMNLGGQPPVGSQMQQAMAQQIAQSGQSQDMVRDREAGIGAMAQVLMQDAGNAPMGAEMMFKDYLRKAEPFTDVLGGPNDDTVIAQRGPLNQYIPFAQGAPAPITRPGTTQEVIDLGLDPESDIIVTLGDGGSIIDYVVKQSPTTGTATQNTRVVTGEKAVNLGYKPNERIRITYTDDPENPNTMNLLTESGSGAAQNRYVLSPDGSFEMFDVSTVPGQKAMSAALQIEGAVPSNAINPNDRPGDVTNASQNKMLLEARGVVTAADESDVLYGALIGLLEENPDINTWGAKAIRILSDLSSGTEALLKAAISGGVFAEDGSELTSTQITAVFNRFDTYLGNLNVGSAKVRSLIMDLAYRGARAKDPGGRITEPDIRNELEVLGAEAGTGSVFLAVLRASRSRARGFAEGRSGTYNGLVEGSVPKFSWQTVDNVESSDNELITGMLELLQYKGMTREQLQKMIKIARGKMNVPS